MSDDIEFRVTYVYGRQPDRPGLLLGDHFTHTRTGVRFVCTEITKSEHGTKITIVSEHAKPARDVK